MKIASLMIVACCITVPAVAASPALLGGPALDLDIEYYSKVLTPEGVTREARYQEKMVRRPGHVWVARTLPRNAGDRHDEEASANQLHQPAAARTAGSGHTEFNHVVLPRHVMLEDNKVRVEYVDAPGKAVVAIPASEYANVNFDGSWETAFFLLDPSLLKAMPRSARPSSVPGAHWREREKNGMFERVLWDAQKQIPLVIESGDKASTFYRRVEVKTQAVLAQRLPWQNLGGYAQKEFSDYLD
jgi:hypothetical protein